MKQQALLIEHMTTKTKLRVNILHFLLFFSTVIFVKKKKFTESKKEM